jgi:hypothetical protein
MQSAALGTQVPLKRHGVEIARLVVFLIKEKIKDEPPRLNTLCCPSEFHGVNKSAPVKPAVAFVSPG